MRSTPPFWALVFALFLGWIDLVSGADLFWTNRVASDFTNTVQWISNGNPVANFPGDIDNANFTNAATYTLNWTATVTNANAFFNPTSGTVTQAIGSSTWLITNSYILGQNAGKTASVVHTSGALVITNGTGNANLTIGQSGIGNYTITGGSFTVDQLTFLSSNSTFVLRGGTGTVLHGSTINSTNKLFAIGNGGRFVLNVLGGTNIVGNNGAGSFPTVVSNGILNVSGSGTVWSNADRLYVGYQSSGNLMVISNGAQVADSIGIIGRDSGSANTAMVSDAGTLWFHSADLAVGNNGARNSVLIITNGARVVSLNGGSLGAGGTLGSSNNYVLITGAGSTWSNGAGFFVGTTEKSNSLNIANGGLLQGTNSYVGYSSGSSRNVALVTDSGSIWTNSDILSVGETGTLNQLTITNLGQAYARSVVIGNASGGNTNTITVTSTGSLLWSSSTLTVGNSGSSNRFNILNGALAQNATGYVGYSSSAKMNTVLVDGTNSIWTNTLALIVGETGVLNQVIISNTGKAFGNTITLGNSSSGNTNTILVSDIGSILRSENALIVGNAGASNRLGVLNGALVQNTSGYVGNLSGSKNNSVLVSDNGSIWTNSSTLSVGETGVLNQLIVTNLGKVYGSSITIGSASTGSSNLVLISDTGSVLWSGSTLVVGNAGNSNRISILNGGLVQNTTGYLGQASGSRNNSILVSGAGSIWTNSSTISVGETGILNSLVISNGGAVYATSVALGNSVAANTNSILLSDAGSILHSGDKLITVGNSGSGNSLVLANGASWMFTNIVIGNASTASNNTVVIRGTGSILSNSAPLMIGLTGVNSRVTVSNSGAIVAPSVILGAISNGSGILDLGGLLSNTNATGSLEQLVVGQTGKGTLTLTGGTVVVDHFYSTNNGSGFTNSVFTMNDGSFTVLSNSAMTFNSSFAVGSTANKTSIWNILGTIDMQGTSGRQLQIGNGVNTVGNVIVSGSGTIFSNGFDIRVGNASSSQGALLVISNGATASFPILFTQGTSNNNFLVTDPGTSVSGVTFLGIGNSVRHSSVIVSNGASLLATNVNVSLGFGTANSNNVIVTDAGSVFRVQDTIFLSQFSGVIYNRIIVTNGGTFLAGNIGVANVPSSYNQIIVSGTGSYISNSVTKLTISSGTSNQIYISSGGVMSSFTNLIASGSGAFDNMVTVTDPGSYLTNRDWFFAGSGGARTIITVSNGAGVFSGNTSIGQNTSSSNNTVTLTDSGSIWINTNSFFVGNASSSNQLGILNNALLFTPSLIVGASSSSVSNSLLLSNGLLFITNSSDSAVMDIRGGTVSINGGVLTANQIYLTNGAASAFLFSSGTLNAIQVAATNNSVFTVGDGIGVATNNMLAGSTANAHSFANGLTINTNSVLNILASERLDDTSVATLQGGTFNLGAFTETFQSLVFDSGKVVSAGATLNVTTITNLSGGGIFQTDSGTLAVNSTIVGAGALTKTGAGILTLSGVNTYSGGTMIGAGTLQANTDSSLGNAAGTVTFDGGTLQTIGSLGTSTRNLIINTTKTGIIDSGGFDSTFSGTLTGDATTTFNKTGAGAITLSGNNAATFLGNASVSAGHLVINGSLGGNVDIQSGAMLSGSGSMASLWNQGTLNPGNSPGTITIHGAFTNSGTLVIELASPSSYDMVVVDSGGTATLGGTLAPTLFGGYAPTNGATITNIITATAGVNGTFGNVLNASPTLRLTPLYFGDHVDLVASVNLANPLLNLNPSQTQLANALANAPGASSGDLANVIAALNNLSSAEALKSAYDEILPRKFIAMGILGVDGMRAQSKNMRLHWNQPRPLLSGNSKSSWQASVGEGFLGQRPILLAYNGDGLGGLLRSAPASIIPKPWRTEAEHATFYLMGSGIMEDQETTVFQPGYNNSTAAVTVGMDWTLADQMSAGIASGYAHSSASMSGTGGKISVETFPLWLNANASSGHWYFHGGLGYAHNLYDTKREIEFPGIQREARGEAFGHQGKALVEMGHTFHHPLADGELTWGPTLSCDYAHAWIEPFEEKDAQSLNLRISRQEFQSIQTQVGGQVNYSVRFRNLVVIPNIHLSWWHEFADDPRQVEARLAQGSDSFGVWTDTPSRNAAVIGAGLQIRWVDGLTLSLNYQTQAGRTAWDSHSLSAGLNWNF